MICTSNPIASCPFLNPPACRSCWSAAYSLRHSGLNRHEKCDDCMTMILSRQEIPMHGWTWLDETWPGKSNQWNDILAIQAVKYFSGYSTDHDKINQSRRKKQNSLSRLQPDGYNPANGNRFWSHEHPNHSPHLQLSGGRKPSDDCDDQFVKNATIWKPNHCIFIKYEDDGMLRSKSGSIFDANYLSFRNYYSS